MISNTLSIACIDGSCCVIPRKLPVGARNWLDVCPSGGNYLGAFCDNDRDCGMDLNQGRICEQQRYCCTDPDYTIERDNSPRNPRDDGLQQEEEMCDEVTDSPSQTPCFTDSNCFSYDDAYCGDGGFCCIPTIVDNNILQLEEDQQEAVLNEAEEEDVGIQQPITTYALCYNSQRSRVRCTSQDRCKPNQSCINGLCCTRTGDEWQNACGGTTAVSSCFADRTCQSQLFCTSSAFCCECPYGQAASKYTTDCPPNYVREVNGYCCPRCLGGQLPYGSCYNNQCADNYICQQGNICCPL